MSGYLNWPCDVGEEAGGGGAAAGWPYKVNAGLQLGSKHFNCGTLLMRWSEVPSLTVLTRLYMLKGRGRSHSEDHLGLERGNQPSLLNKSLVFQR